MGYSVTMPAVPSSATPVILSGPGLITIRIPALATYRGARIDPQALANAINAKMAQSATYASFYSNFQTEGAIIWFLDNSAKAPRGFPKRAAKNDPVLSGPTDAISHYPRNSQGIFTDNPSKPNQLQVIFDSDIYRGSGIDYGRMADVIPEEIILHPLLGSHTFDLVGVPAGGYSKVPVTVQMVQNDQVSLQKIQVDYELSTSIGKTFSAHRPINVLPTGAVYISQNGLSAYQASHPGVTMSVTQPGRLTDGTYVVTEAQFREARADHIANMSTLQRAPLGSGIAGGAATPIFYTEAEIAQIKRDMAPPNWAVGVSQVIGSTMSRFLLPENPFVQVAGSTLLNTVSLNALQTVWQGGISKDIGWAMTSDGGFQFVKNNVLDDFGSDLVNAFQGAAVGTFSSFIALELGNVLGIKGFGAELLQNSASTVLGQVLNNAASLAQQTPGVTLFSGLDGKGLFGNASAPGLLSSSVGSFLGSKLGSLILSPNNTAGAVLASLGSGVGVIALTTGASAFGLSGVASSLASVFFGLGSVGVPLVGSLVGFLLGSLLGRVFGKKKPRVPSAYSQIDLNLTAGEWYQGSYSSSNGGDLNFVRSISESAKDIINGILTTASAGSIVTVASSASESQRYGHNGSNVFVSQLVGGSYQQIYTGTDSTKAVDVGVLSAINATKVRGGDLIAKRAIFGSSASSVTELVSNIAIAQDYSSYLSNKEFYNQLFIDNPNAAITASWLVTIARADEIGLTRYRPSDFFGGLGGFASSFGFGYSPADGLTGLPFESLLVSMEGAALRVSSTGGSTPFKLLSGTNNVSDPTQAANSVFMPNFGANVGYTMWSGQATAGNDIWVASDGGPVTMDDSGYVEEWRWNQWDYSYEPYYTYVTGGDDIFVGSAYADSLFGRAGFDWLDGGAGDDLIDGGENDDVMLGRAGNDRILGGSGHDYLAGGDGDDYFFDASRTWGLYGGEGNDVLVGGAGMDALYGENGDDVFIVDQDGGGTWDSLTGQGGSDTLSYERFTSGVYIDFATLGGWSWDPTAKYIYGDAIAGSMENVTGSQYADAILGDSGGNILRGLDGNDTLQGRDGDDALEGGAGSDQLNGGSGSDQANYLSSNAAVSVDLAAGLGKGGDAEGDTFVSIENVSGSVFNDRLKGDAGNNRLSGLEGDDLFQMSAGQDFVDGGAGTDWLTASESTSAFSVYFDAGNYDPYYGYYTPGVGWIASTDSGSTNFINVEAFVGSSFGDSLSGSSGDEVFEGAGGNDYIVGGGGSDTFVFNRGAGQDTVYSSSVGASSILLKQDINWRDVSIVGANYSQQYGNLTVAIRGTSDLMTVGSNFYYVNSGSTAGQHTHAIKTLNLGGGSTVDIDMIDWTPDAAYEWGTTVYGAQNRSDLIFAYGGDDTIYSAGGGYEIRGNVVYAGDGNDTIIASAGDDQYIFERSNGIDTLHDAGGADTIVMGPSVAADDVIYEVVGNDLYIGIRDTNNPNAAASQVADRIRVVNGGVKYIGMYYGGETLNTVEHVRVGGQEIDLTKANITWTISYVDDGYYGGGGGGGWNPGGPHIPPLAIDLDGDGIELRSVEGSRIASVGADGTIRRMGWLGQDDGFLALDRDGNGVIDRIGEISFIGDKEGAKTDLEGLAAYDSNGDGKLDASDKRWGEFKVWQDKNQDGFGSKDELVTLDKAGIAAISLKGQATGFAPSDGIDNAVIATTEITWTDKTRTGSAYDVMLAQWQVRTDGGAKLPVNGLTRGGKSDDIEALLHGVQGLTEEQVKALREKKTQAKGQGEGEGGLLYRIEDLLGTSTKPGKPGLTQLVENTAAVATVASDGLLSIDPTLASKVAEGSRTLGLVDRYADSDWTKLGSLTPGKADMRGVVTAIEKRDLAAEQKTVIADARKIVADRKLADEARATTLEAKDVADAELRPAPTPPTAAELERLKQTDKFLLLEGSNTDDATDRDTADIDLDATERDLMRQFAAAAAPEVSQDALAEPVAEDSVTEAPVSEVASAAADTEADASPARPASTGDVAQDDAALQDLEAYGVVIRTANARLVQALASFGDAPAMMASYQGLNVANDAQAAWLSVDAMPSVQRLAAIR